MAVSPSQPCGTEPGLVPARKSPRTGEGNDPLEWSLEPPPKSVPATAVALHLLPSPPPPSTSTGSFAYFFPLLLPPCMLSVPVGPPAPSCCTRMLAHCATAGQRQGHGSWGSRTGQRGGERSTTAVSHDPRHGSTLQSPFLHPAARRQHRPPALAWGAAHLWQRGEKRWVSLGSSLRQSQAG